MMRLSQSTLPFLSDRLPTPTYDRASLRPSIVHIGVGGFHRAHQAVYLDELARAGETEWGEVGVSLRTRDLRSALDGQDGLFSVVEQGSGGHSARVIGSMREYLFGPDDPWLVVDRLADPSTRLLTLTVTGDGYSVDAHAAPARTPESWTEYVVAALARRRSAGLGGFTVLSCDNLADSGGAARRALLARAGARDETLARWIDRNVSFPDAMVDRITPGTDDAVRRLVADRFGVHDRAPVAAEPFRQWVVEDTFCAGRPPLEDVGVRMVSDVTPYKLIKSRLLNGTHTAIAYLGRLAGHRTTAEFLSDPTMRAFASGLMRDEVAPVLPTVPGMSTDAYVDSVLDRLSNPFIADPLDRLCRRGSTKVPAYLLPSLADAAAQGRRAPLLSLALAGWLRYLRGRDMEGRRIVVEDARSEELQERALRVGTDPAPLLELEDVFGPLAGDPWITHQVRSALRDLDHGVHGAVRRRLVAGDRHARPLVPSQRRPHERVPGAIS
jgi:mannitol-1-phosphate/altronate dehydrogenase